VVPVLTVAVAVLGSSACVVLVRAARRAELGERVSHLRANRRWRVPGRLRAPLARALHDADVRAEPEAAVQVWAVAVVTVALVASWIAPVMAVPAAVGGALAGPLALRLLRDRRERRFGAHLPGALEQVAHELRGGGTVAGALGRLGDGDGPVADDVRRVIARTRLGLGLHDALAAWPAEHPTGAVRAAAGALAIANGMGGRAGHAIDGLASSLRDRLDAAAEAHALSAQSRLSAIVVGAAPVGFLAFSGLVDPSSVTTLIGTGVGRVCLVVGLALEGLAALWIRRIVRSEG
jgi:tight adherence protein B